MKFCMPMTNASHLPPITDVIDADDPLLASSGCFDRRKRHADNLCNIVKCRDKNWVLPIQHINHHMFEQRYFNTIRFTKLDL